MFTAGERVVPIQYPIKPYKYTEMDELLYVEHSALLTQGISNFSQILNGSKNFYTKKLKQKQYMKAIQAPYTAAEQAQKKEEEKIRGKK